MNSKYFYKDKPILGLDIGSNSVKVMQVESHNHQPTVIGYGVSSFDSKAIKDGVIIDHVSLATSINELFKNNVVGEITTRRVAITIPATRTFTRSMNLPVLKDSELAEAVSLEAEQYIPVPLAELYIDYSVIDKNDKGVELLAVAVPKKIVDSYMVLIRMLGLEPVAFDTSINAGARLFEKQAKHREIPAVLIDFGSISADITLPDKTIIVTGTIPFGGDTFTEVLAKKLRVSTAEANIIKTKYGLGKSKRQEEIIEAMKPGLEQLAREIRRMIRYHEERSGSTQKIGQIVTMGGGASMAGLSEYLTDLLRLPVRMCNPWEDLQIGKLQPPNTGNRSMFITVSGLSLITAKELFT